MIKRDGLVTVSTIRKEIKNPRHCGLDPQSPEERKKGKMIKRDGLVTVSTIRKEIKNPRHCGLDPHSTRGKQ